MAIIELVVMTLILDTASTSAYQLTASVLESFDDLLVTKYQLWSKESSRELTCFRLCLSDVHCVSFHYKEAEFTCVGYPVTFASPSRTATTKSIGNKLYITSKGEHHYGAACSQASDCSPLYTDCLKGVCKCRTAYYFSDTLFEYVSERLGCFTDDMDRVIEDVIIRKLQYLTIETCIELCQTTGYVYAGVENSDECQCGTGIDTENYPLKPESECWMPCVGDPQQLCGGPWAIAVYKINDN